MYSHCYDNIYATKLRLTLLKQQTLNLFRRMVPTTFKYMIGNFKVRLYTVERNTIAFQNHENWWQ